MESVFEARLSLSLSGVMDEVRPRNETEQPQSRDMAAITSSSSSASTSAGSGWCPDRLAFAPYVPQDGGATAEKSQTLRAVVRKPVSLFANF